MSMVLMWSLEMYTFEQNHAAHQDTPKLLEVQMCNFFDGLKISVVKKIDESQTVVTTENELIF